MIKTGQAWAGLFVTLDATGAASAADSTPTGALYVDGVSNAASVTITGTNPYKFAVTLPTLTAGQRVDMYITATIDTIATAGIVASAQADTVLVSDIVGADSDTLETLSDQLDAAATASALSTLDGNITAILADTNEIQAELADGGRTDLLIDAIKAKTDTITAAPTAASVADAVWDEAIVDHSTVGSFGAKNQKVVPSETVGDYKADVSALALAADLQDVEDKIDVIGIDTTTEIPATLATLATSAALATVDGIVDDIKAKTDLIPAIPAQAGEYTAAIAAVQADLDNPDQYKADVSALATTAHVQEVEDKVDIVDGIADAILDDTGTTGVLLSTSALGSIFDDEVIVGTYTFSDLLKIMAAALAGKLSGGGSTTLKFEGVDGASDVIVTTVDANKNRTNVVITV